MGIYQATHYGNKIGKQQCPQELQGPMWLYWHSCEMGSIVCQNFSQPNSACTSDVSWPFCIFFFRNLCTQQDGVYFETGSSTLIHKTTVSLCNFLQIYIISPHIMIGMVYIIQVKTRLDAKMSATHECLLNCQHTVWSFNFTKWKHYLSLEFFVLCAKCCLPSGDRFNLKMTSY